MQRQQIPLVARDQFRIKTEDSGRFLARDEVDPWLQGEDGANLLLIAAQSPIELSHFVAVGVNLAVALCPTDTLAGVLLSRREWCRHVAV